MQGAGPIQSPQRAQRCDDSRQREKQPRARAAEEEGLLLAEVTTGPRPRETMECTGFVRTLAEGDRSTILRPPESWQLPRAAP